MKHLYIRTEANKTTAMGHMMRCVSIAKSARKLGAEVTFIVAEESSGFLPEKEGFEIISLNKKWDDFDSEIPIMEKLISDRNIEILLIDSYWINEKYMQDISKLTRTAYIDDLHDCIWPADILINYSVYYELFDYSSEYRGKKLLLGTDYFPLRSEYIGLEKRIITDEVRNVLVVSGGSDELHFMKNFVSRLITADRFADINFTFILGNFNSDYDEILKLTNDRENIKVLKALPTLKDAMLSTDLIISAGGTSLYETAACSLPAITYILADNQYYNATNFAKKGLAIYAGDIRESGTIEAIEEALIKLIDDKKLREKMSDKLFNLLDGKGADRIAEELCSFQ